MIEEGNIPGGSEKSMTRWCGKKWDARDETLYSKTGEPCRDPWHVQHNLSISGRWPFWRVLLKQDLCSILKFGKAELLVQVSQPQTQVKSGIAICITRLHDDHLRNGTGIMTKPSPVYYVLCYTYGFVAPTTFVPSRYLICIGYPHWIRSNKAVCGWNMSTWFKFVSYWTENCRHALALVTKQSVVNKIGWNYDIRFTTFLFGCIKRKIKM